MAKRRLSELAPAVAEKTQVTVRGRVTQCAERAASALARAAGLVLKIEGLPAREAPAQGTTANADSHLCEQLIGLDVTLNELDEALERISVAIG